MTQAKIEAKIKAMMTNPVYKPFLDQGAQSLKEYKHTYCRKCRGDYLVPGADGKPKLGPNARRLRSGPAAIGLGVFFYMIMDFAEPAAMACGGISLICGGCDEEFERLEQSLAAFEKWNGKTTFNCQDVISAYIALNNCAGIDGGPAGLDLTTAYANCATKFTANGDNGNGIGFSFPFPPIRRVGEPRIEGVSID